MENTIKIEIITRSNNGGGSSNGGDYDEWQKYQKLENGRYSREYNTSYEDGCCPACGRYTVIGQQCSCDGILSIFAEKKVFAFAREMGRRAVLPIISASGKPESPRFFFGAEWFLDLVKQKLGPLEGSYDEEHKKKVLDEIREVESEGRLRHEVAVKKYEQELKDWEKWREGEKERILSLIFS